MEDYLGAGWVVAGVVAVLVTVGLVDDDSAGVDCVNASAMSCTFAVCVGLRPVHSMTVGNHGIDDAQHALTQMRPDDEDPELGVVDLLLTDWPKSIPRAFA